MYEKPPRSGAARKFELSKSETCPERSRMDPKQIRKSEIRRCSKREAKLSFEDPPTHKATIFAKATTRQDGAAGTCVPKQSLGTREKTLCSLRFLLFRISVSSCFNDFRHSVFRICFEFRDSNFGFPACCGFRICSPLEPA